jgi:hypothetical protein
LNYYQVNFLKLIFEFQFQVFFFFATVNIDPIEVISFVNLTLLEGKKGIHDLTFEKE